MATQLIDPEMTETLAGCSTDVEHLSLPTSGRTLVVEFESGGERVAVCSAAGETELVIDLTKDGPVVSMTGGKLQLQSADSVDIRCKHFSVRADETTRLDTGKLEIRAEHGADIHSWDELNLNARETHLRCSDDIWLNGAHTFIQCP